MRWRAALAAALLVLVPASAMAQEFGGLDIGQPIANTQRLGLPLGSQYVGGYRAQKWARPNGVELSITAVPAGPIVYMESFPTAYHQPVQGDGLRFRMTTQAAAIDMLGGPGFYFTGRGQFATTNGQDVWFHSYALTDRPNVIVTFAFTAPVSARRLNDQGQLLQNPDAVLDSMIVADYAYQLKIWGGEGVARPGYNTINLKYQ
ncbi:MAG: hypothetical protein CML02_15315 [Pseudooceanicola sp.]|jgi:hypothetical protein|nr:hypothetical protein [Pseudooceanicola sp.]|tara:strand:- start:1620 stop:2231 length:612 start_codon:yes stop_codon:yes gene_type:complete